MDGQAGVIVKDDAVGDLKWIVSVESSVVRAHQHSAGARKKRGRQRRHRVPRLRRRRTRQAMRDRQVTFVSQEREDRIARRATKGSRGRRPPACDTKIYKQRNVVEGCFNRLKQFRDVATRYAKCAAYYQAGLTIAAIVLWLR
ncbi:transposase [Amycolatopsis nalaikhensis]|uniref:Transposase n=1 Tax=Amycolatopsis nalaikhensis TaxID=715472 RepID=A0ABY8XDE7_9PSEU|nr:transposase [Amycolatopsis sp. 2-2]WIV52938.1 transposase [Amycolatopsis sp. 2-2]